MRLYVTVANNPAIIVGYGPGAKVGQPPRAIIIGLGPTPMAVELSDCILPKMPKKLMRKIKARVRAETADAQASLAELH